MALGLEIADLALRTGISRSYLSRLETGVRRHMRLGTYRSLCSELGLPPDTTQLLTSSTDTE